VGLHLWETAASTGGRARFARRIAGEGGSAWALVLESVLVLLPLAVHVSVGLARIVRQGRPREAAGYPSAGSRGLQWITGALVLAMLVVHLGHTWVAKLGGTGPFALYDGLRTDTGRPLVFAVYVTGLTALCLHLAQGLVAGARRWVPVTGSAALPTFRVVAAVAAVLCWVVSLNTLSHFVVGRALLWEVGGGPPSEGKPSAPGPVRPGPQSNPAPGGAPEQ
jgi:hypothetical protein